MISVLFVVGLFFVCLFVVLLLDLFGLLVCFCLCFCLLWLLFSVSIEGRWARRQRKVSLTLVLLLLVLLCVFIVCVCFCCVPLLPAVGYNPVTEVGHLAGKKTQ